MKAVDTVRRMLALFKMHEEELEKFLLKKEWFK